MSRLLIFVLLAGSLMAAEPVTFIKQLGAEKFAERQTAERELIKLAEQGHELVLTNCAQAYRKADDPEVRLRLKSVMEQVVDKHLFSAPRGFLGVQINNVIIGEGGQVVINGVQIPSRSIWIGSVVEDSGAAKAGLQPNDLIIAINDEPWTGTGAEGFTTFIQSHKPGTTLKLSIIRGERTNEVSATLGELPEAQRAIVYGAQRQRQFFEGWWQRNIGEDLPVEP